jgi:hypothetical protein
VEEETSTFVPPNCDAALDGSGSIILQMRGPRV